MGKKYPKILGLITARGGSKGIPRKNIKKLCGKPLIAYTIESAKKAGVFDRIILSTDDSKIAKVSRTYKCDVPFTRPKEFSEDKSSHLDVVKHAVLWLKENEGYFPKYTMILQPTSPLRQGTHIKEAVDLILESSADSVLSVAPVPENYHPRKIMTPQEEGILTLLDGSPIYKRIPRRQDLQPILWSVGLIYLFRTDLIFDKENPNFYGEKVIPLFIEPQYVVDINVPDDWGKAEEMMKKIL